MEDQNRDDIQDSVIKLRVNPQKQRDKVCIGCGAGFRGDRPLAALKLLQRVQELNYLVLECLAERTLADHYRAMMSGLDGFDSQISEWIYLLLPLAMERGTCIITNMGAMDPTGAREKVLEVARKLGLSVSVAVAHEVLITKSGPGYSADQKSYIMEGGKSTYLGAAPIVECLEKFRPNVIITSRVADASLFLAPMVFELGWNWDDLALLAQGTLAGHLLECGCQLTGGYFIHPGDKHRSVSLQELLNVSLPYAEISCDGRVCVAKPEGTGGVLSLATCSEQLLYEVGDPGAYITPDLVVNFQYVLFQPLSSCKVLCAGAKPSALGLAVPEKLLQLVPEDCGWKGWGEISYGGDKCLDRAKAAEFLVRSWMEEAFPGINQQIICYIIGLDSLKATNIDNNDSSARTIEDIRLRMDGLFEQREQAVYFTREFTALYTNGPAGGGGISTGHKKEILLKKQLVRREYVFWHTGVKSSKASGSDHQPEIFKDQGKTRLLQSPTFRPFTGVPTSDTCKDLLTKIDPSPAASNQKIALYNVAHSRAGDKENDLNFSIIPHFPPDIERLKVIITPQWVKQVVSVLLKSSSFPDLDDTTKTDSENQVEVEIYEVMGIRSLNVVVRNILDGGVNCSRRIDRHGKTISDLILSRQVILPP